MKEKSRYTEFTDDFRTLGITKILTDLKIPRSNFYKGYMSLEREKLVALTTANKIKTLLKKYEDILDE